MKVYQTALGRVGVVALVGVLLAGCSENDRPLESPGRFECGIFGTYYQITLVDPLTHGEAKALEEGILAEMEDVDQAMSTYRDDSELVAFNDAPLNEWQPVSNELIEVLAISRSVAEASEGAFDITIGDVVNLWSFGPEARPEEVPSEAELSERMATIGFDAVEVDTQRTQARRLRDVFADLSGVAKGPALPTALPPTWTSNKLKTIWSILAVGWLPVATATLKRKHPGALVLKYHKAGYRKRNM